ncbi:hypothetical protein QYE76_037321 [Lolium multiflorum]|uniref:Uncharacterized protein n=1 Tax=Lolium multiflorum TaxID=4521 RepID=A0AAD8PP69_LOLMU|nr:hypothetical protein QYE76_037321 [Lolium multiflorum]
MVNPEAIPHAKRERQFVIYRTDDLSMSCLKIVSTFLDCEDAASRSDKASISNMKPLVKDFGSRWKAAIELMHKDVIKSLSNFLCGMEILKAALTQLLTWYT